MIATHSPIVNPIHHGLNIAAVKIVYRIRRAMLSTTTPM